MNITLRTDWSHMVYWRTSPQQKCISACGQTMLLNALDACTFCWTIFRNIKMHFSFICTLVRSYADNINNNKIMFVWTRVCQCQSLAYCHPTAYLTQTYQSHCEDLHFSRSFHVIHYVTIRCTIRHFLLGNPCNQVSISNSFRDMFEERETRLQWSTYSK